MVPPSRAEPVPGIRWDVHSFSSSTLLFADEQESARSIKTLKEVEPLITAKYRCCTAAACPLLPCLSTL